MTLPEIVTALRWGPTDLGRYLGCSRVWAFCVRSPETPV